MPMKPYNPMEQLSDRLVDLYPHEHPHIPPKNQALINLNVVIKDALKKGSNIQDIMEIISEHAPKINSNSLKKIRDNFKAEVIECYDNKADLEEVRKQIDTTFDEMIEKRLEIEENAKKQITKSVKNIPSPTI